LSGIDIPEVLVKMSSTAGDVILIRAIMQLSKRDQPQK
jgi:uncharacterized protein (UPF0335 family)